MASPDIFALRRSVLNPFLYADIAVRNGAGTLTIVSLLGRRGYDPWEEAERLARLPTGAAVASLAAMIVGVPTNPCSLQEATAIAERLVALLPRPAMADRLAGARPVPLGRLATAALGLGVVVVVVIVITWLTMADAWRPRGPDDRTRLVDPSAQETSS